MRRPRRFLSRLTFRSAPGREELLAGPLRGEILGPEHLAERARALARGQKVASAARDSREGQLLRRLNETGRLLQDIHARLADEAARDVEVGPAGEWLLDNFYVVREHIREIGQSLPKNYYRELPALASGPLAGYARIYELAITLISHTEARADLENVTLFVTAFQGEARLSIGELWAIPAMLRLGLIESVRRMALRTVQRLDEVALADDWASRIEEAGGKDDSALGRVLDEFIGSPPPLTANFVTRFLSQLRRSTGSVAPLVRLEEWIGDRALSAEHAGTQSTQHLALTQVMMAQSITSLRAIERIDWRTFVESQSALDAALRQDPARCYEGMTFTGRDRYRHVAERIAKQTGLEEVEVAFQAVELAASAARHDPEHSAPGHVGFYLIGDGLPELERRTGYSPTLAERVHRTILAHPNILFGGGILCGTVAVLAAVHWLGGEAARGAWMAVILFALIPANDIAIGVMNQLVTAFLPPRLLPQLDFREKGIPAGFRTAVVVPTLFPSVESVHFTLEHMEVQYLANREENLHFAILSDFTDADAQTLPGDDAIVRAAVEGVRALNARYAGGSPNAFFLFHRPRRWNAQQGVWMGWERKRGKLGDFNRILRGGGAEAFSTVVGDVDLLQSVRYVITLDADTVLPRGAASLLVGTLAHPLNRAVYDPALGCVTQGYGILQPRVGVSLPSAHLSRFAAIYSGHPGVDPYTTAVSDVYQDLYGQGSFTGKGIYDVDVFERATHGRFPENTLLSHDLIEGSYARAGLATDINLYDDYPSRYLTFTRRKHRWIRGDWQLVDWLTRHVPGVSGVERNRLSVLSRWKILDNLRRSTVEIAQLTFLIAGWTVLPGSPVRWTGMALGAIAAPWIISLLLALVRPPLDRSWRAYYSAVGHDVATSAKQVALAITFLPHQAWISADAILRTLWRLLVSRRYLLEWQTASQAEQTTSGSTSEAWRAMGPAVAAAVGLALASLAVSFLRTGSAFAGVFPPAPVPSDSGIPDFWQLVLATLPLAALWTASPAIAFALSTPLPRQRHRLPRTRRDEVLRYALLHWRFFDRFVGESTHWLVPDNFQEDPTPVVAMRTSPTNIGFQLLATVSAQDLGFLTITEMVRRLELAFGAIDRLRHFRGHLFNWYDLSTLEVLEPGYVSTVDSGNLAGALIAVRQACLAIPDGPAFDGRNGRALHAALGLVDERLRVVMEGVPPENRAEWRRVVIAAEALRLRRTILAAGAAEPARSPEQLAIVEGELRSVLGALEGVPRSQEATASITEWLDWSLDGVRQQWNQLEDLGPAAIPEGGWEAGWTGATLREIASESTAASQLVARLESIANRAQRMVLEMDFRFLFDEERELFSIGYQHSTHARDESYYDLLASEARLASFLAVAKDDAPPEHWFRLGRMLTLASGETALVSWSGSMFEYLMPLLLMKSVPQTVLEQTERGVVGRQIAYGATHGVPWGVSESAYNLRDRHLTYQYRAFGVPDLGLKRGLERDLVIAPYASALALMVEPEAALENLARLERKGALGRYGFRDAVDYTRPNPGQRYAVVCTYMAHHVGMGLIAFTNGLTDEVWQHRFHADPMVRSAELLLHERLPRRLVLQKVQAAPVDKALPDPDLELPVVREFEEPDTVHPHIALLGRLPYTIMLSHSGSGYSRYEDLAVTRWRADATMDSAGQFCYVKDLSSGRMWSATHQPVCARADWYRAMLATDRATFHRADGPVETRTDVAILPEDSAEVRVVTVTNHGAETREVELTSYAEIVMTKPDTDRAHPAFANLFVETEWHEWCTAITATRRPRSATERALWCVHVLDSGPDRVGPVTCETDRARFLGRGSTTRDPVALADDGALSGTTGAVLDPIFALRTRVRLAPGQSASVAFTTLVATSREEAFALADRYHDPRAAIRALDLAWTSHQLELRELDLKPADAAIFQELAGHLLYPYAPLRASQDELRANRGSQPLLWAQGISGDYPIVFATIDSTDGLPTLRELFAAHHYWRRRGMTVDLVVVNTRPPTYLQELHDQIVQAMFASSDTGIDRAGGVFFRRLDLLSRDELLMLRATARLHLACDGRALAQIVETARGLENGEATDFEPYESAPRRLERRAEPPRLPSARVLVRRSEHASSTSALPARAPGLAERRRTTTEGDGERGSLRFDNGLGGMSAEHDYHIRVRRDFLPPAPWSNVIANPHGGFVVTERGGGFTWAENSYFFRLTPWHNDPVSDSPGEVLYLRDEESRDLWSATPAPIDQESAYHVRHGAGSSTFEHEHVRIATHLTVGMAEGEAVKLSILRVTNRDTRPRRLTVTAYAEWTLGIHREHTQHQVTTRFQGELSAIFAENTFDPQFAAWTAFCAVSEPISSHTGDRAEFVGRNGSLADPAGLRAAPLTGTVGAGFDPCAALQCLIELAPGETREVTVLLGAAKGEVEAREAIGRYRATGSAAAALGESVERWADRLSVISVRTPEPSFDAMLNRWALYQALACRMWARSALYQSSGAYGFRDQLQDVMAFVYAEPAIAREHILRAAARQFVEGDVQHWWHPQSGRGVRTRFSDDLAWLPYVVDHYVRLTGDHSVLDAYVPFLAMRPLEPHEHEVYDLPGVTDEHGSVYEHCLRALRKACTTGSHGLPLIGIGDWNDGMNRVGVEGRGESVWLAWFLVTTLRAFAVHAESRGDLAVAGELRTAAEGYAAAVEAEGWDGEWYRRAYFDDGTPLGSVTSEECRIDSIAQSWSVISGSGRPDRQARAMRSFEEHLVRDDARLLMLLTPPFDKTSADPGYIKGYLPGVRENGAQYTHAALWAVLATALRGEGDRAFELYQMINPLMRTRSAEEVARYKVEPYVVAADVYTAEGHLGRGGWTWYTGSASWMYRIGLEAILGFTRRGDTLTLEPRVPGAWPELAIEYRFGRALYAITVFEPARVGVDGGAMTLDGQVVEGAVLKLTDDGERHEVIVRPATASTRA